MSSKDNRGYYFLKYSLPHLVFIRKAILPEYAVENLSSYQLFIPNRYLGLTRIETAFSEAKMAILSITVRKPICFGLKCFKNPEPGNSQEK